MLAHGLGGAASWLGHAGKQPLRLTTVLVIVHSSPPLRINDYYLYCGGITSFVINIRPRKNAKLSTQYETCRSDVSP